VAGWPGGRAWVDNASLQLRSNVPFLTLPEVQNQLKSERLLKVDWTALVNQLDHNRDIPFTIASWLLSQTDEQRNQLIQYQRSILKENQDPAYWIVALMATPEYQMA